MIQQTKARIFLADERGHNEIAWMRSYNTFNFGNYKNENKTSFGSLYVLNDDTLAARKSFSLAVQEDSAVVLIPIVGTVAYSDSSKNNFVAIASEALQCTVNAETKIILQNPYESETVNFLQLWIKKKNVSQGCIKTSFDINTNNRLHNVFDNISIGKFDGRADGFYKSSTNSQNVFAFVIEGAFEVQNRLLHARDGLALWNVEEVEFEALSNEAIIIFVECDV